MPHRTLCYIVVPLFWYSICMSCILLCDHRSYQHIVTPTFRFLSWCSAFLEGSDTRSRSSNFGRIFSSSDFPSVEMKNVGIPILWRNQLSDFGPVVRFSGIIRVGWPSPLRGNEKLEIPQKSGESIQPKEGEVLRGKVTENSWKKVIRRTKVMSG